MEYRGVAMHSIRLFTGNRLDLLAEELAGVLETPLESPFDKETIIVQSKGMERWLSMRIASHLGVCANCSFPFPNAFLYEIFQKLIPDLPDFSLFEPRFCTWKIMDILPGFVEKPGFENLRNYLEGPGRSLKQLQLSRRIAETFDQYVIYRPDLIERWEAGEDENWQAVLWREVIRGNEGGHRAALGRKLLKTISGSARSDYRLPKRISVFGISYLPPFYMHILAALGQLTELNIFFLNPCREYWGDIASKRDVSRALSDDRPTGGQLYMERGNPLLSSLGTMGRDFFELITSFPCEEISVFDDPEPGSVLAAIQSDILNLVDPAELDHPRTVAEGDRSIQIRSCHGAMREVEALYDHLLEMFEQDPALIPKDILVMTPDVESYAPFIQAVFDNPENERKRIPFSIADRSMRQESRTIDTFLALLALQGERITAPQVMELLECESLRRSFGLSDPDMELALQWVREARIRWGIDENDRLRWYPAPSSGNTWKAGIERLLLGYAMRGRNSKLFQGILPFDDIEGGEAAVLGNFLEFLQTLFNTLKSLESARTLSQWSEFLQDVLSRFFRHGGDLEFEMHALRQTVADLAKIEEVSGFGRAVDLEVVRWHLGKSLEQGGFGFGFMTGGVTFCSMLPMRSIPFKVICIIGMNENAFPRQSKPAEFDLIARHPRPGDKSVRNEDRYLFLEALLAARRKLYISYTGQSAKDNSLIPPSVLVSELADTIESGFVHPDGAGDWYFTRDRLQAFNPAYFTGEEKLFSYSGENALTARCILAEKHDVPMLIENRLDPPGEEFRVVAIEDLCRFFANPAKYLLNNRLGIYLREDEGVLEDSEAFEIDSLDRYSLGQVLLESVLAGAHPDAFMPVVRASGLLPHGVPGECIYDAIGRRVELFAGQTAQYASGTELEPLAVDVRLGDFILSGKIRPVHPERLLRYRHATIKAKDHLSAWIMHLVLNLCAAPGYPGQSMLIGLNDRKKWQAFSYDPVEESGNVLGELLELYWEGLSGPVHFFPETSLRYALTALRGRAGDDPLKSAASTWIGNEPYHRGERKDPYLELCFKSQDPLDSDFELLSRKVFQPLFASRREV